MQEMYDEDVNAPFELRQSHTIGKLSVESDGLIELVDDDDQRGRRRTDGREIDFGWFSEMLKTAHTMETDKTNPHFVCTIASSIRINDL